jgi:hypothetical protein
MQIDTYSRLACRKTESNLVGVSNIKKGCITSFVVLKYCSPHKHMALYISHLNLIFKKRIYLIKDSDAFLIILDRWLFIVGCHLNIDGYRLLLTGVPLSVIL